MEKPDDVLSASRLLETDFHLPKAKIPRTSFYAVISHQQLRTDWMTSVTRLFRYISLDANGGQIMMFVSCYTL